MLFSHIYVYIFIYIFLIAGQTAESNWLHFLVNPCGYPGVDIS